GFFYVDMHERDMAAIIGSTEEWDIINVLAPEGATAAEEERRAKMLDDALPEARRGFPAELVFAGDQFIITPAGRAEEAARAQALPALHRRSDHSASAAAGLDRYRGASFARHTFQYSRRPARRSPGTRQRRLSTNLDGRQDGRVGGNAASREGGRDQCPLV